MAEAAAALEEAETHKRAAGHTDSIEGTKSMNSDKNNSIFRKGMRGKMTPQTSSIQRQSPKIVFHENYCFLKEITKKTGTYWN